MNKDLIIQTYNDCRNFSFQRLNWLNFDTKDSQLFWERNQQRMELLSLDRERFLHLSNITNNNNNFDNQRQQLHDKWRSFFQPARPREGTTIEMLRQFQQDQVQLIKGHVNYLACNWVYGGTTTTQMGHANDITTPHFPVTTHWDLNLTTMGSGIYSGKNYDVVTEPGTLVLIPPNETLHYQRSNTSSAWVHKWMAFQGEEAYLPYFEKLSSVSGLLVCQLTSSQSQHILTSMEKINAYNRQAQAGYKQQQLLDEMLDNISSYAQQHELTRNKLSVGKARQFIRNNLGFQISIDDIARECHLSASRLAHLFRSEMGISPIAWRDELRIAKACQMLSKNDEKIGDISQRVGYDDQFYFSKLFKKRVGYTPSQYRSFHI